MTAEEFKKEVIPFSRKLYPMLKRILRDEEETRDALQDLMLRLWDKRNDLDKCINPGAYIVTVAKNYSFDMLKKKRPVFIGEKEQHKLLDLEAEGVSAETREKYQHVHTVIEQLPEKYRTIIRLRDIDGFSFEEIQQFTGLEITNIRVILSRARMKVKQEVEKIYDYEKGKNKQFARQIL
jgi:RNA polymerase sigma-70 factor (ECF subfamily)